MTCGECAYQPSTAVIVVRAPNAATAYAIARKRIRTPMLRASTRRGCGGESVRAVVV